MDCVVSSVSNNEMRMECCIPQFIVQITSGDILYKLHKGIITLVNSTFVMLFVISFLLFFSSHIILLWLIGLLCLVGWMIWRFVISSGS